jgi:hypothetical protein
VALRLGVAEPERPIPVRLSVRLRVGLGLALRLELGLRTSLVLALRLDRELNLETYWSPADANQSATGF